MMYTSNVFLTASCIDSCLKDGSTTANSMDQTVEAAKEMVTMEATKPNKKDQSPFAELYQMIKQDLDPNSPWKTPLSKRKSQKPATPKGPDQEASAPVEVKVTPKKMTAALPATPAGKEASVAATPKSAQKKRRSSAGQPEAKPEPVPEAVAVCVSEEKVAVEETSQQSVAAVTPGTPGKKRRSSSQSLKSPRKSESEPSASTPASQKTDQPQTPQKFSAVEVVQQILSDPQSAETPNKSPKRRRSSSTASPKPAPAPEVSADAQAAPAEASLEVKQSPRTSPRANAGQRFRVQEVLDEIEASAPSDSDGEDTTHSTRTQISLLLIIYMSSHGVMGSC